VRNPLSFNLSPINRLIDGSLILTTLTPLIFSLSNLLLSCNQLTIFCNCLTITSCELVSYILVLLPNPKVIAAVNGVVVAAFSGMLTPY